MARSHLSRGNPAYAVHREDACHLHLLVEEKKPEGFGGLETAASLGFRPYWNL